ncbi:MAG: glycosyltransferase family 2 protein, partial [Candidatus Omnitrophica bacterium]|nr:glycosyltransferase family 2 protein [Candidatus Omnitrophota bacterium]
MKVCIVIPVYNESRQIGEIVKKIKARGLDIVVIDDGSTDHSYTLARDNGAVVIAHPAKQGKGVSLRDGFSYAVTHGFDGVVAMDGDGQHAIEDIDIFIQKVQHESCSVISGNRMLDPKAMPFVRRWVNRFMSFIISSICHQSIPDSQCGFRFISTDVLKSINLTSTEFEIETEVLVKAARKGFKISSVPIQTIYRDEFSKINPWTDT